MEESVSAMNFPQPYAEPCTSVVQHLRLLVLKKKAYNVLDTFIVLKVRLLKILSR